MKHKKKIILLAGPTASGKSKLAIKLAEQLNGEIINADSMQVYKEISILTSRPSVSDLKKVKHHLYGFKSITNEFSSGDWLQLATIKIKNLLKSNKTPIVVGGTGLYFKSLTDGLVKIPNIPIALRKEIRDLHIKIGQKEFYKKLLKLDPLSKNFVINTDSQRSMRAYEVKKFTKNSLSIWIKKTKSNFNNKLFINFFINPPRELLYKSINYRVEKMFRENVLNEVINLKNKNIRNKLYANNIIGMKEIKDYLDNKNTLTDTKELIKIRTRQYSKRQFTWSRGHMKSWNKLYSSNLRDLSRQIIIKIS